MELERVLLLVLIYQVSIWYPTVRVFALSTFEGPQVGPFTLTRAPEEVTSSREVKEKLRG